MESHEDAIEQEERVRKFTEKGRQYDRQKLNELFGKLNNSSQVLIDKIQERTPLDILRPMFSDWMITYEHFLEKHDRHLKQLSTEERDEYLSDFQVKNNIMQEFSISTKKYIYEAEQAKLRETQRSPSVKVSKKGSQRSHSSRSSTSTSRSNVSSRRLQEEEKKVELLERMKALQKRKDIEMAKTELKLKEEELELSTDLAVSEAKTKLLEKFERLSEESEDESNSNVSVVEDQGVSRSNLNVHAKPFIANDETSLKVPLCNTKQLRVYESTNNKSRNENVASNYNQAMESTTVRYPDSDNSNIGAIDSIVRHLRKPVPEIKKFSGDPMEYRKFLRQFQAKIMSNTNNNEENMSYLEQYTIGEANKVISGFSHLNGEQAFPLAMKQLEDRYGNQDVIGSAFAKKALDWPSIKYGDTKALDNFALFLVECENAVTSIGVACILEFSENIRRLVSKLPHNMHDKWRNIVLRTKESGDLIKFSQFVSFVKQEAKKVNDPLYGCEALGIRSKSSQDRDKTKTQGASGGYRNRTGNINDITAACTNSNNANNIGSKCYYCQSNLHRISDCKDFMSLKVQDRCNHVRKCGLCFGCLKKGHRSSECKNRQECAVCKKKHPTMLHDESKSQVKLAENKPQMESSNPSVTPVDICGHTGAGDITSAMSIIPVRVKLKNKPYTIATYAFFDTGSNVTFCTESLMNRLGTHGKKLHLTLGTIGDPYSMETYSVNGLQICDMDMNNVIDLPKVYTKDELPVTTDHIPNESEISRWPHLSDIKMPNIDTNNIEIMIGGNVPDAFTPFDIRTGPSGSPHATKTRLGWIVWNITRDRNESHKEVVNRTYISKIEEVDKSSRLEELLKESIKLDFPERQIDDKSENSLEDTKFLTQVNETVRYDNGHFSIKLPFRDSAVKFPSNKPQAFKRLKSLRAKFDKMPKFREDYRNFMDSILEKGYAEEVPNETLCRSDGKVWYLPHHGVYHQRKPNKVRVVFDCSAVYNGVSLNRELLQGPDLTNNLLGVILRFRKENVAILGDIEAMFHQVKVPVEDRDCLRFLWWPNGDTDNEVKEYRMTVHLFGATSSPSCCNFAIKCTAEKFGDQFEPHVKETLMNNMNVDDCLASVNSTDEAINLGRNLSMLCEFGGFHLTKWTSNEPDVIQAFPEEETVKHWDPDSNSQIEHALGICWFVENDHFGFQISLKDRPVTRRGILSIVSSIYDPLGIVAPFVLIGKIILQDLCKMKIGWDEAIPESENIKWKKWLSETSEIQRVVVKRSYKPENFGEIALSEIHCFSDASNVGYGMVFYLRMVNTEGKVHCAFLLGKSRVAPLKSVTIPRLELTAASRSVRICEKIKNEINMKIDHVYYWTDSMSVLRYICNTNARFHTFVANRLTIIHEATSPEQWNYIATKENPADCASRGVSITKCNGENTWLQGPDFLWHEISTWPQQDINKDLSCNDTEVKQVFSTVHTQQSSSNNVMSRLLSSYSDWTMLKRITAWILRYIDNLRSKVTCNKNKQTSEMLSTEMLETAEKCLIKYVQQERFPEEYKRLLKEPSENVKKSSKLYQMNVFMKDGIIRSGGRLRKSDLLFEAKYPIVLPKESQVSKLLVESVHRKNGHLGKNSILANLRQKYWIIGVNSLIKRVLSKCVTCKKYQGLPEKQKMADLPSERLQSDVSPFTNIGIDFFGPFYVKRARSQVKRYGVIFTCLSSRALHLEVAHSLDTDSCINAIRRFIARRGVPKSIRTDNGTNFVSAERELKLEIERWNLNRLNNYLVQQGIKWEFNPPAASHFGGVWERLIRSIRKVLYSVTQEQSIKLDDEGLQTLFCEVEAILNGRPLTEATNSVNDLEVLTPNHLLLLKAGEHFPPGLFDKSDNYVRRRWRQIQYLADLFWRRWTKEYLPLLQIRQKWNDKKENVKINDIVLIVENTPRNLWNMGRIIEVFKDDQGQVRVVKLKTASGILTRPISKLCKILEA